ncbi:ABC transporter ATP-binding protein [Pseudonocardia sp. Cha107L01]|jgi:putative ABC transport system ATP-binding protein|uniref:ABC transporter ATP-binding protein n=1 Tax=Pseudonocardia sp. Cha107L01 TaxID=3457576 RepID=UPI00403EAC48
MALDTAVPNQQEDGRVGSAGALIRLEEVSKIYRAGPNEEIRALDRVNMTIEAGEFVAVMGPSSAGKTTLMNVLGCLDPPSEGRYFLDGTDVSDYSQRELARIRGSKVGCVFQSFNLIPRTSASRNVELPLVYAGIRDRTARASRALEQVGLSDRMKHMPSQLSGGQQQRVCIARALVADPMILVADEPTGALDSVTGREIIKLLVALHEAGRTVVLITHEKEEARVADRVIHLRDGRLIDN